MPVTVRIPVPLRPLTQGLPTVQVSGGTLAEVIDSLEREYPGLKAKLLDEKGKLRSYQNIYMNDKDVRYLQELATPVKDGDEIAIFPAIAGG